jgi:ATP-dependent Lon protease
MKKEYNLRNKKLAAVLPPDSESEESEEEDSEYTTTSTESTESEISSVDTDEDDESEKDPVNVNITFTLSKDDYEEESESSDDEPPIENNMHLQKEVLDKLLELKTTYKDLPIIKELELLHTTESKKYEKRKSKMDEKMKDMHIKKFEKLTSFKTITDVKYFMKLSLDEQITFLAKLESITNIDPKPLRIKVIEADIPNEYKIIALKKMQALTHLSENEGGEYYKIKHWIDAFMDIPFGIYKELPISIHDGVDKCHEFMENAKSILDKATYGLTDAKIQIMQYIGQLITNPKSIGTCIAFEGPMGTGKTTLVKEGISKILNRPFAFFALGGATDSSTLEGHSITYEGSVWGKIVDTLKTCKCMNPVFYFDELDKVAEGPKGDEIIGILTHLTDTSQNDKFHDKYFAEFEFDLSRAIFIFSYNIRDRVNPILRDRMYVIQTEGYTAPQKLIISKDYLSIAIQRNINFQPEDVIITDASIQYIIEKYTNEKGVRELKRCIENIYTKLNLFRIMKPSCNLFEKELNFQVSFPFTVHPEMVKKLLKQDTATVNHMMYM